MKVLVANRGEIACRVLRSLREAGVATVAVHSDVDAEAPHVWLADEAVSLTEVTGYLDIERVLEAARRTGANAVHPGYGFLSENPTFAEACAAAGITFIGPPAAAMRAFADKREAGKMAAGLGVPVIPGATPVDSLDDARKAAVAAGYPVVVKAAAGGGGKGMRRVSAEAELEGAFTGAQREARGAFGDDRLFLERFIHPARHVEVQILGDGERAVAVGERECSLQRRYQKVVEESPSPGIDSELRERLFESAITLAEAVKYEGAGTVEFLVGPDGGHYFLEMNTRLQVEHPITEMRFGMDLVAAQLRIATGGGIGEIDPPRGAAIEVRLNAEDPYHGFLPASGRVEMLEWPTVPGVRVDTGIECGSVVSPHYDPMLAKIIAWGADREAARRKLVSALKETVVLGLNTNHSFLVEVLQRDFFVEGETYTTTLESHEWLAPPVPAAAEVVAERVSSRRAPAMAGDGTGDRYSPWLKLGNFRMGS